MKPPEIMGGSGQDGFLDTLTRGNIILAGDGRGLGERIPGDGILLRPHLQMNDLQLSVIDTLGVQRHW